MDKSLKKQIIYTTVFPLAILGVLSMLLFTIRFYNYSKETAKDELFRVISNINYGDKEGAMELKTLCDVDISFLSEDKRIFSTLDKFDAFIDSKIFNEIKSGTSYVYNDNTIISGTSYNAYYLAGPNGTIEAVKPANSIFKTFWRLMGPVIAIEVIMAIIVASLTYFYASRLSYSIQCLHRFVQMIKKENFDYRLEESVYMREDEIGQIGKGIVSMRNALQDLIEVDALTKLYNRKTGEKKLKAVSERSVSRETPFCIAIGDIDFFKKVNDTYGHESGDAVLRKVAEILKNNIQNKGFGYVSRWGGEEFLLIFDNCNRRHAAEILQETLQKIRNTTICHEDFKIKVTMTFGLVRGSANTEELFSIADSKLYYGKEHGRNQVVSEI